MVKKRVAVIGAGITGVTAAYALVKEGYDVTVFEEESDPAMKTSYANGGQVSVSNSEVWNTWSNVWKGAKWILKKDAPLLIRPSLDLDKAIWLAKFLYHTANNDYAKNTAVTIAMGLQSRALYQKIIADENLKFDQSPSGILHIYKDAKYWNQAIQAQEIYESNGCEWTLLDEKAVKQKDPALNDIKGIVGGVWTKDDWTGDIHKFCYNLSNILEEKYNVRFVFDCRVESHHVLDLFDVVVVSAGVGSVKLAKRFGDRLPIYPVKGYSITIPASDIVSYNAIPKVSILDDQAKIVTSNLGARLRVAGTAELAGENYDIRRDRIEPLLNWVKKNFPKVKTHEYSSWACLRPMTPNMMPIVRRSYISSKVYYHTGHGHLGWTISPYTANKLVEMIKND